MNPDDKCPDHGCARWRCDETHTYEAEKQMTVEDWDALVGLCDDATHPSNPGGYWNRLLLNRLLLKVKARRDALKQGRVMP